MRLNYKIAKLLIVVKVKFILLIAYYRVLFFFSFLIFSYYFFFMYNVLSPIGGVALGHVTQLVQSCQMGRTYLRTKHGRSGRSKIRVSQWSCSVFIECVCICVEGCVTCVFFACASRKVLPNFVSVRMKSSSHLILCTRPLF